MFQSMQVRHVNDITMILEKLKNGILFVGFFLLGLNFFISGIAINLIQLVLWITVKPLNLWLYRKINYYCTFANWGRKFLFLLNGSSIAKLGFLELEFLAEWWSSSTCLVYTDDKTWAKMGSEHAILLLNHSYEVDWLFSWFMCEQIRTLGVTQIPHIVVIIM